MVVDVVASRRRRYEVVKRKVAEWKKENEKHTIAWLVDHPLTASQRFGLSLREMTTVNQVAQGLHQFTAAAHLRGDQEDTSCKLWAERTACVEFAPRLDRFVGSVKGVGLALFAYMRMRSGVDTIKPDKRIKDKLNELGFSLPNDDHAVMIAAKAAAIEVGVPCLVLDQLL